MNSPPSSAAGSGDEPTDWPALAWEQRTWVPSTVWGVRAEREHRQTRYRSAVPPLIADRALVLASDVLEEARQAEGELTRFDAELGHRVTTFAPVLLRSEAASSSRIENLTASARAVFSAELGAATGRNAAQIVANTTAMTAALELSDRVSAEGIRGMHAALMGGQERHTPGRWRDEAVWIGKRSDSPIGAEFVAPHHSLIPELIDDLAAFGNREDLPPLVTVALAHAQFETIHPFTDGNGRTGRALVQSMLRLHGVTRNVAVPVSAGLLADVNGYHAALTAYRAGDPAPILRAMTAASLRAVGNARRLVEEIDAISSEWRRRLQVRSDSHAWRLLDVLTRRPVLHSAAAAAELGIHRTNVYPALRALTDAGILHSKNDHRLGPFWRSPEILAAIDAFAKRAGRREAC